MLALAYADYQALRKDAEVIEADFFGDKVLRLEDGNFMKLFRRKRLISSAAFFPYAQRFSDNAVELKKRGVRCPDILATYRVATISRDVVHYEPLPGLTLRQVIADPTNFSDPVLLQAFGRFVANLHNLGIYFRSLHLGNVVMTPDNELGLIDIADMRTLRGPLRKSMCLRNFQHMRRYRNDHEWLLQEQGTHFFNSYSAHSTHGWERSTLIEKLAL
ncbi:MULTISPECIES: toluene tolerance protein [unclassified Pseudomonas]|uniref:toluene tolerance protein n=1 Tax=unclassified Pseudomonas TaxID=196821 RepID=UPI002AC8C786|nr:MULTISPECIES: toluene tolerance protein [unclassified Pseudomonas]MEB0041709.1 toluene tolerance protein [Pseudomonas sp. MH10]MEB0079221.1 toluene tolerance protein [Pseudomonas sp. MH10out]MEB0090525.1 toluene tolerance protein [Pseudomonas sp. CCI4.2]MEB0103238.1 toluene tolerance protein [Pseudomonas sp. CCI3.2]MEB0123168.1 toluene tolerance protein [Pseudomonas sp. CCI1.2]